MAGRPRKRSEQESLDIAMVVFWRRGFEATSMSDLSAALEVGPSSIYNAFGSKEALFQACIEHYLDTQGGWAVDAMALPNVVDSLTCLLRSACVAFTREGAPGGCAVLSAGRLDRPESSNVDAFLLDKRLASVAWTKARIEIGIDEGQLRADTDIDGLARFVSAVVHGLSQQALDGASEEQLMGVARFAMRTVEDHRLAVS